MFTDVKDPQWTGANHATIILDVESGGQWSKFVASQTDVTDYGRLLYHLAVHGKFGKIADSEEELIIAGKLPVPEGYAIREGALVNIIEYAQAAQTELDLRLAELNSDENKARAVIDEDFAVEWKARLTALLAVKGQPGWPQEVIWPD